MTHAVGLYKCLCYNNDDGDNENDIYSMSLSSQNSHYKSLPVSFGKKIDGVKRSAIFRPSQPSAGMEKRLSFGKKVLGF